MPKKNPTEYHNVQKWKLLNSKGEVISYFRTYFTAHKEKINYEKEMFDKCELKPLTKKEIEERRKAMQNEQY